jgi:hypothetical protein
MPLSLEPLTDMNDSDIQYLPIKWALIVLGGSELYEHPPGTNSVQKVEHWIQSRGVPYDIVCEENIEEPTDMPTCGKYPLQYANGTIRYAVFVIITKSHNGISRIEPTYVYEAVSNGTNAVVFGTALKYVPLLLNASSDSVSYFADYGINQINCVIDREFSDGIITYHQGTAETLNGSYFLHSNVSETEGKTVWYTMHSNTGKEWVGMMNATYGFGNVFWSTTIPSHDTFFRYGTFSVYWETRNLKFIAHTINFMFNQVTKIDVGLQGYKRWKGALTYRLDQDSIIGISQPPVEALEAGWYVDVVITALGYLTYGGNLSFGIPEGYIGAPSTAIKYGNWTNLIISTEPLRVTSRIFIVFNSTPDGNFDSVKVDWNQNGNFADEVSFHMWENMTSGVTGLMGTYYWGYIDDWTNPTSCKLGWWCPLRDRISDFSYWRDMGFKGFILYGLHSWQHQDLGYPGEVTGHYVLWNGSNFIMDQNWIAQKFSEARDEIAYCLGGAEYGFDASKSLVSNGGNEYEEEVDAVLFKQEWVYLTYGDNDKNEPGWFLYADGKPAMSCGGGAESPEVAWNFDALKDAVKTLFPIFGIYKHASGAYNMSFDVNPLNTAYTDMFCFAHLDDSFEFWSNSRYLHMNTINAYYKDSKIVLEYKANNTLKDYVWKFPVACGNKRFTGFADNRTVGKIKHVDGKYVYVEFAEGANERIEVTYGFAPSIHKISCYVGSISQSYSAKNLSLQISNLSQTVKIVITCGRFEKPSLVKLNASSIVFDYDSLEGFCSFNLSASDLSDIEISWEFAPPDPPILISPQSLSRFDPNRYLTFTWLFSDSDTDDFQTAYRFQLFVAGNLSAIVDTGKVNSSTLHFSEYLPTTISLYYWRVKTWDSRNVEGEWSDSRHFIVDRLKIASKSATDDRVDVGSSTAVHFHVSWEYDNLAFVGDDGIVYITESAATWDSADKMWKIDVTHYSVGKVGYRVSSITDFRYNVTTINDIVGTQKVIWDRVIVEITPGATVVTVNTQVNFTISAIYAYDNVNVSNFTINVLRNGTHFAASRFSDTCEVANAYQYVVENVTELEHGLTAFGSNITIVTWIPKTWFQLLSEWLTSNALIIVSTVQLVAVLAYILLRERRKQKNFTGLSKDKNNAKQFFQLIKTTNPISENLKEAY